MAIAGVGDAEHLRARVDAYLRAHHTMTVATSAPTDHAPHAAHVFYAAGDGLRLVFLSQPRSIHGQHIGNEAAVAVTVSEEYVDWKMIQGVQLWGRARRLRGAARASALALYIRRFPFVRDLIRTPTHAAKIRGIGVYEVEPERAGFTDNTSGVFGRELLDLSGAGRRSADFDGDAACDVLLEHPAAVRTQGARRLAPNQHAL